MSENIHNNQSLEASCIMQCGNHCSESNSIEKITLKKCENMEEQIKNVQLRCTRFFMHNSCYIKLVEVENCEPKQSQNFI